MLRESDKKLLLEQLKNCYKHKVLSKEYYRHIVKIINAQPKPPQIHLDFTFYQRQYNNLVYWLRLDDKYNSKYTDSELVRLSFKIFSYLRKDKRGQELSIVSLDSHNPWIDPRFGRYQHNSYLWSFKGYQELKKYVDLDNIPIEGQVKHYNNKDKNYITLRDIWSSSKYSIKYNQFYNILKQKHIMERKVSSKYGYKLTKEYRYLGKSMIRAIRHKKPYSIILIKKSKIKELLHLVEQSVNRCEQTNKQIRNKQYKPLYVRLTEYYGIPVKGLSWLNQFYLKQMVSLGLMEKGNRSNYYFTKKGLNMKLGVNVGPPSIRKAMFDNLDIENIDGIFFKIQQNIMKNYENKWEEIEELSNK